MKFRCSYCGLERADDGIEPIGLYTHGICRPCFEQEIAKNECEYGFNCPYHPNGVGCCSKYFNSVKENCDHFHQMKDKEEEL